MHSSINHNWAHYQHTNINDDRYTLPVDGRVVIIIIIIIIIMTLVLNCY